MRLRHSYYFLTPLFILTALCFYLIHCYNDINKKPKLPAPTEGEENDALREKFEMLRHKAAKGVDWKSIEFNNRQIALQQIKGMPKLMGSESFANGAIVGEWTAKGAYNQTGSVRAVDYVPATNMLYNISNGGSLWKSTLNSGAWTLCNQTIKFEQRSLSAFTRLSGGTRVLLSSGAQLYWTDDEGQTLHTVSGVTFPVSWGGNYVAKFLHLNDDANTIYCLVRLWSDSPWAARFRLYRSTNEGESYSFLYQFNTGDDEKVCLLKANNSNNVYVSQTGVVANSIETYGIAGATVTPLYTYDIGNAINNCLVKAVNISGLTTMYAMVNNNLLYKSISSGQSWTLQSNLPENAWNRMNVSYASADVLAYGGVNCYRSTDAGLHWTKVNDWGEYYGNPAGKLHADIMEIEWFKKADNTDFTIINTHGGAYCSYDNLATVSNESLNSHVAVEYYDVLTDTITPGYIYAGSQDQGLPA